MRRKLSPEWQRWLTEHLLLGNEPRDLERVLRKAGLSAAGARDAVDAVVGDPCFRGAFRATSMQRKLEGLMDGYGALYRQAPAPEAVERRGALGAEELLERYVLRSRPVITRGSPPALATALGLGAPRRWPSGGRESALRQVAASLVLYQESGARALTLVPWCDILSVTGRARGPDPEERRPLRLRVELSAGDLLLIPAGWWYQRHAGATGPAACRQAGGATRARAVSVTAPPRNIM